MGGGNFVGLAYDTQNTSGFSSTVSAIMFAASSDSGKTWSTPVTVVNDGDLDASPAVTADSLNHVWVSWWDGSSGVIKISQMQTDGSFSTPVTIAPTSYISNGLGVVASNSLAIDRKSGNLYDAMTENNGGSNPLLMRSSDGGATWSPGATFNSTYIGSTPAIGADASGRLYLTFLALNDPGPGAVYSRVVTYSADGGSTFTTPVPLNSVMFPRALLYGPGSLILAPDGSTFADFGLQYCAAVHCLDPSLPYFDQGTFGQTTGFLEQSLQNASGPYLQMSGFFHGSEVLGLALGPGSGGLASFDLVQATPGGSVLSWPIPVTNVQQIFAVGNSAGAVFATRQGFDPGFIVPGVCE